MISEDFVSLFPSAESYIIGSYAERGKFFINLKNSVVVELSISENSLHFLFKKEDIKKFDKSFFEAEFLDNRDYIQCILLELVDGVNRCQINPLKLEQ